MTGGNGRGVVFGPDVCVQESPGPLGKPKGEYEADTHRVERKPAGLRPLKLMQTSAKAAVADDILSKLAERIVCPLQRGFFRGSQMLDNDLEFDCGLYEHTQAAFNLPGGFLLDSASACPSMAHDWILSVLCPMGCPQSVISRISALYHDLESTTIFGARSFLRTVS